MNPHIIEYVNNLNAPQSFKDIMLRVSALSRRKREKMRLLVAEEYQRNEWNPDTESFDAWNLTTRDICRAWFIVHGILNDHNAFANPHQLSAYVAMRTLRLLDALEKAESADDVTEIPS